MPATLYLSNGESREVVPENGTDFQLDELYRMIDCDLVQLIKLQDGRFMIVDEEGKLTGKSRNDMATVIAYHIQPHDEIVGHALVCEPSQFL